MNFGEAIEAAKTGETVFREAWAHFGGHLKITGNRILWASNDHEPHDYTAATADILATDWNVAEAKK